jgi:predicted DNA binding CopG/RHH family protein
VEEPILENHYPQSQGNTGVSWMKRRPLKLDEEGLQIYRDFESEDFESIKDFRDERRQLEAAAGTTLQKDKRINIRISVRDLAKIHKRAIAEGMP